MTEESVGEVLKTVAPGSKVRITFRTDAERKLSQIVSLRRSFNFNQEWLTLFVSCVVPTGRWEGIERTQEVTVSKMVGADREICAHILAETAESVELI